MATFVFERITADQAAAFTATDNLIFLDTSASALSVTFAAATGLTAASITLAAGGRSVVFPAATLADASQANLLTFTNGSVLYLADVAGGTFTTTGTAPALTAPVTFYGFAGNDTYAAVAGSTGAQIIHGGGGNDVLTGGDGADYIFGGLSATGAADTINGGAGNDHLYGGDFTQGVTSTDGADVINGDAGDDYIQGNAGNDTLNGGVGGDRIFGGAGDDVINGDAGADVINGNQGNDTINGGDGNDEIRGGQGDDSLVGGAGQDIILGDLGADTIIGGAGIDVVSGGEGADVFRFALGDALPGSQVQIADAAGTALPGAAQFLTGFYDSITDFKVSGADKIDFTPVGTTGGVTTTAVVLYAATGVSFAAGGETAALTYAQQLMDNRTDTATTYEVAAIQVGTATYLFAHEGGATIDTVIRLDNTTASTIVAADFI